jgi:hypothetical protein
MKKKNDSYIKKKLFEEDIPIFLKSFSNDEIEKLLSSLKSEIERREVVKEMLFEKIKSGLLVIDFLENVEIFDRLRIILKKAWEDNLYYTLDDISFQNFRTLKNAGLKSWTELINIVSNIIEGTESEQNDKYIINHFRKITKGNFRVSVVKLAQSKPVLLRLQP